MSKSTQQLTLDIITAVQKRRPMWDSTHHLRKNANFMWSLWHETADEVKAHVQDVRSRWKHLRSYYANTYKEHARTGNRPTWQYYKAMSFLSDVVEKSWKEEEEQEKLKQALNFDGEVMNLDEEFPGWNEEFPGWNEQIVLDIPQAGNDENDPLVVIDTTSASQKIQHVLEIEPKEEPSDDPSESSSEDLQKATIEIPESPEQPTKIRRMEKHLKATASSSSDGQNVKAKVGYKRKIALDEDNQRPENESSRTGTGWLAIERRKLELLEKEVAEEANPDLSFFKSLLPALKFFSEPQKLRVRMAINQIILREYKLVREKAVANCFEVKK